MPPKAQADPNRPNHPTLFLVDGYALIYRAFFAMLSRPLTTSRGENTSAAWGVVNFLQRMKTEHQPDHIGWVLDAGSSFRKEVYPDYKATREKLNEELQADFDRGLQRIAQLLSAYRVPIIAVDGYEADDVIATLARQGVDQGYQVVIVSGDKDFQQLVRPGLWLLNPGRGGPAQVEEHWVGMHNANERLGVVPERVVDYLALVGDSSDNVPGVPGIGDKTARDLVNEYGDLERILRAAPDIKGKRPREALLGHPERARLSKTLVTIRDDVPVTLDVDALRTRPSDIAALRPMLVELEFTNLLRDLDRDAPRATAEQSLIPTKVVEKPAELESLVEEIRRAGHFALRTVTTPEPSTASRIDSLRARLVGIAISFRQGESWYLPFAHRASRPEQTDLLGEQTDLLGVVPPKPASSRAKTAAPTSIAARLLAEGAPDPVNLPPFTDDALASFRALLADPAVAKTAHNAKFDDTVLRRAGVKVEGLAFDTMLASYVLDPGRRSHAIDLLAVEFLGHPMASLEALIGKGKDEVPMDLAPVSSVAEFAGSEAEGSLRLREIFEAQLTLHGQRDLLTDIELPLSRVLGDMERAGVSIDIDWFRSLQTRFRAERERIEREIYAAAGSEFNINSNQQLRVILFDQLNLPVLKRTPTGPSTDASVLQELAEEGHQLPVLLMEYREIAKLESTYLDTLPELVHPADGRLHTSFNQTVAATGRLSSSDPNLQNIPIRRELGRDIRRGFVAQSGWKFLVADYSQIELRLLAHLSNDPAFVTAFRSGEDIHRQTAAIIFGVDVTDVTSEMRARAKTINFATIYGQGANALARQLRIPHAEAKAFIETYFTRFGGVRAYLDSQVQYARENGYVETIFHRRRYIPELRDRNFNIRAFGERVATNAPIQGSAADLIKVAMIRIHDALRTRGLAGQMLLQVHDELVLEAPPNETEAVAGIVREAMENAAQLSVPLVVDLGVGPNWVEAKA
ncbi:MAG TPA: DNA polymerase I [Gemmatimonadaceae bacterium]